jgi:hypothetical protein
MLLDHVLYQAQVTATGGREGRAVSSATGCWRCRSPRRVPSGAPGDGAPTRSSCLRLDTRPASCVLCSMSPRVTRWPSRRRAGWRARSGLVPSRRASGSRSSCGSRCRGCPTVRPRRWSTRHTRSVPTRTPRGATLPCAWCSYPPTPDGVAYRRKPWEHGMPRTERHAHATRVQRLPRCAAKRWERPRAHSGQCWPVDVLPGLKAEASTPPDGSAVAPAGPHPFLPALNGGVPRAFLMGWRCIRGPRRHWQITYGRLPFLGL